MHIETSSNNYGNNVFVSLERTDIIQISNIPFDYNRFSNGDNKAMGRFRIQLILEDNTRSTQYTIAKSIQYSNCSSEGTLLIFRFYCKKVWY